MIIDLDMLGSLSLSAAASERRRKNLNFHADELAVCNRLLNAIEPDSYVQPHCHFDASKDETMILLKGRLGVLYFSENGEVVMKTVLDPECGVYGVNIPHGTIHTVVSLQPGTVFFEAKAGPYVPISDAERAPWAPREGAPDAFAYLELLKQSFEI